MVLWITGVGNLRHIVKNINYVSDPNSVDYYALASETMLTRAGDCDDYAILIASMYEAVGLDAFITFIDADNDNIIDHMACLVHYSKDADSFIEEEKVILKALLLRSPTGELVVLTTSGTGLEKYDSGIWIVIDPLQSFIGDAPGFVKSKSYTTKVVLDVGN